MAPALDAVDHVHVFVADRAAAVDWYRRVMGLEPAPELAHWAADGGPLTLRDAGDRVHLALFERPRQPCRSTVALRVAAPAYRQWRAHLHGVLPTPPTEEDHGAARSIYFSDPDGNPYEITTYDLDRAGDVDPGPARSS